MQKISKKSIKKRKLKIRSSIVNIKNIYHQFHRNSQKDIDSANGRSKKIW